MVRKLISLVLALAMLVSCAAFTAASAESGSNVLTIALDLRPNLDIHWNSGAIGAWLMAEMYEGLYEYTEDGFALAGATDVKISEDGLVWTFALREDAKWSDGKAVTAEDYVNSFRRLVNPEVASTYMVDYGQFLKNGAAISNKEKPVEELGAYADGDFTLRIELEAPCSFFDALLCYTTFYPLRTETVVEDGLGNWAWEVERNFSNGPLKVVYCNEEQEIRYEKNEYYWNKDNVNLDGMIVKLADDSNTMVSLLTSGAVDLVFKFPAEDTQKLMDEGYYHKVPALGTGFLMVNNNKEPLSDARVRQALSMSFDRDYLADVLLLGTKTPAKGIVGPGFPGSSNTSDFRAEGPDLLSYDPDQARALLAEAGFPGGQGFPVVDIKYANSNADYTVVFEYLQAVWEEELGIICTLTPMDPAAIGELRNAGQFDITPQNWYVDYFDASNMLSIFVSSNFINAGRFNNATFDELYVKSLSTVDPAERSDLLHEAERLLLGEDMGIIPTYYHSFPYLYKDGHLENVKVNAAPQVILSDIIVNK